jgi:hypothetical protein
VAKEFARKWAGFVGNKGENKYFGAVNEKVPFGFAGENTREWTSSQAAS